MDPTIKPIGQDVYGSVLAKLTVPAVFKIRYPVPAGIVQFKVTVCVPVTVVMVTSETPETALPELFLRPIVILPDVEALI